MTPVLFCAIDTALIGLVLRPASSLPWDKPSALAWEQRADTFRSTRHKGSSSSSSSSSSNAFLAHPVSSLQWASFEDEECNLEDDECRSWRFVNSAQRAVCLPVDWDSVYSAAAQLEVDDSPITVGVVRGAAMSMPLCADIESLQWTLAAALVDRPVLAEELPFASAATAGVVCSRPEPLAPADGLSFDSMRRSRVGAELSADASVISLRRDTMPLCWPKAFHFAKMLRQDGEEARRSLGAIPVNWHVETCHWEAKHRHRVLAGLLAGVAVDVVVNTEHDLGGGKRWRLPSNTRLRMAQHAQSLLLAAAPADTTGSPEQARLLKRAREALRKAPSECDDLKVTAALRQVVADAEAAKLRAQAARLAERAKHHSGAYGAPASTSASAPPSRTPASRPRTASAVTAAALTAGPPAPGSASAIALATAPDLTRLAAAAMRTGRTIELRGRTLSLHDELLVPAGCLLSIRGPGTIIGNGHTLIRAGGGGGGRQRVVLESVQLIHCGSSERTERRELGGAVFALGKSIVKLRACNVTSSQGFGVWMVQRARVDITEGSVLHDCGRSGVVSFGQAQLTLNGSCIRASALHGICARGACRIALDDAQVTDTGVRGIYAYHNVTLQLARSEIRGTRDAAGAAVQVEALRPSDKCRLQLDAASRDQLDDGSNQGKGLLVQGNVVVEGLPLAAP